MMKLFVLGLTFLSLNVYSQSKEQLASMLKEMKDKGVITSEQYDKSVKELSGMSDSDFGDLKEKANQMKNDPKVLEQVNKMKE